MLLLVVWVVKLALNVVEVAPSSLFRSFFFLLKLVLFLLLDPDPRKNSGVRVFRCVLGGSSRGEASSLALMMF